MTANTQADPVLDVRDLELTFTAGGRGLKLLDGVSFQVRRGETLGLVGESGSGKSMSALSIMGFVGRNRSQSLAGSIRYQGTELIGLPDKQYRRLRGNRIAMVFQEPMTSLDPSFTIGSQIAEGIRLHQGVSRDAAMKRVVEVLDLVRIPSAAQRLKSYPHEFSGGMRQRVLIAMALANNPEFIIADEPTTALDVSIQAQILELLKTLQADLGLSLLFITHNMGVVADICDRVAVMYAGQIVEEGHVLDVFREPRHPYSERLLAAMPRLDATGDLQWIPGSPPDVDARPHGCRFAPRCHLAAEECAEPQELLVIGRGRASRCWRSTSTLPEVAR